MGLKFRDFDDLNRLEAPASGAVIAWDEITPGLGLRITAGGTRAFVFRYRTAEGRQRLQTLSKFDAQEPLALAMARKAAKDLRQTVDKDKKDPLADKQKERDAARDAEAARKDALRAAKSAPKAMTLSDIVEEYRARGLEKKGKSQRYIEETRRNFALHVLPRWGMRGLGDISRADVIAALDQIAEAGTIRTVDGKKITAKGGPIAANRVLAAIRALFNWSIRRGLVEINPCSLIEQVGEERARERTLAASEIQKLWPAFEGMGQPFGQFFQICLLTGQRRSEVARMRWADVDLEAKTWSLGAAQTKNGKAHLVPLSEMAVEILRGMTRKTVAEKGESVPSPWVFTSSGNVAISGFSKAKAMVEGRIAEKGMPQWGIHDLRRTVATEMGRLGVTEFMIGKVLNHTPAGVTGKHYNQYEYLSEKRHALDAWATYLSRLIEPGLGNVVQLRSVVAVAT